MENTAHFSNLIFKGDILLVLLLLSLSFHKYICVCNIMYICIHVIHHTTYIIYKYTPQAVYIHYIYTYIQKNNHKRKINKGK